MKPYHKIQSVFKRDEKGRFLEDRYTRPEFEMLKDIIWEMTEKVDGTNIRVIWDEESKVSFGGRTERAQIPANLVNKLNALFTDGQQSHLTLYGEGFGGKIQKGSDYGDVDFILFDVRVEDWWLKRDGVEEVADYLEIKTVPIVARGTLAQGIDFCKKGFDSMLKDTPPEGLVLRPVHELYDRSHRRIITKLKLKDFTHARS